MYGGGLRADGAFYYQLGGKWIPLRKVMVFLVIILFFSTVSFAAVNTAFFVSDRICQGVKVGGVAVGGLSVAAARERIAQEYARITAGAPLVYEYDNLTWPIKQSDIDLQVDIEAMADEAYAVGRTGGIFRQLRERYLTINQGRELPLLVKYDETKLAAVVRRMAQDIDVPAQDAGLYVDGAEVVLRPEVIGRQTDIARTLADSNALLRRQLPVRQQVTVREIMPLIRTADLADIDGLVASFTTKFDTADENRVQNIALAAHSIDGVLVKDGEEFSFNRLVGPRLADLGYKEAPVFIDGELVPDWGGGVCQVSSTLYNAALLSGMDIVTRTAHPRPPAYVPLGQDATVADNLIDFAFKNATGYNIYIRSEVGDGQVSIFVYGHRDEDPPDFYIVNSERKILEPNTIIKQDPSLAVGEQIVEAEGQRGFRVTTYRVKTWHNQEVGRELLATDEYKPQDRVIRIGTKTSDRQPNK